MTRILALAAILSAAFPTMAAMARLPWFVTIASPVLPKAIVSGAAATGSMPHVSTERSSKREGEAPGSGIEAPVPDALIDDLAGGGLSLADPTIDGFASGPVVAGVIDRRVP